MLRRWLRRAPRWLLALPLLAIAPWVLGAIIYYVVTVLRVFGVELAPAR